MHYNSRTACACNACLINRIKPLSKLWWTQVVRSFDVPPLHRAHTAIQYHVMQCIAHIVIIRALLHNIAGPLVK